MENKGPLKTFLTNATDIQTLLDNNTDKRICLWVIDMQNDFIDAPFNDTTLFNKDNYKNAIDVGQGIKLLPNTFKKVEARDWKTVDFNKKNESNINNGRFAINEGIQCVDDVIHYIDLLNTKYNDRLEKVIFSRDIHTTDKENDINHCSFKIKDEEGFIDGIGFPAHCVNGTAGCKLHSSIKKACEELGNKSLVVMKGCSERYDSFGAFPYDCNKGKEYSNIRQHNGCEHKCSNDRESIDKNTGSFVLKPKEWYEKKVNLNTNERTKIKDEIDKLSERNDMIHLVCGLAGDYCVRDTAINLKFAYPNSIVAVIADATRYAALSDSVIVPQLEGEERKEFLENTLHLKSFTDNPDPSPTYFLTPPDVMLYTYSDKMLPGKGVIFTMDKKDDKRKSYLYYTKPSNDERPTRDSNNKYWCLSRYYYLLGKQMEYCKKCYENAEGFKDNEYKGNKTGRLSLNYDVVNKNKKNQNKIIIQEEVRNKKEVKDHIKRNGKAVDKYIKRNEEAVDKHIKRLEEARHPQGGKRRRKTKKRHNKKTKRKVTKKRHHKKTKKRKVRKTKKNKTRKR